MPPTHLMSINGTSRSYGHVHKIWPAVSYGIVRPTSQTQIAFDVLILLAQLFNLQVLNYSAYLCLDMHFNSYITKRRLPHVRKNTFTHFLDSLHLCILLPDD